MGRQLKTTAGKNAVYQRKWSKTPSGKEHRKRHAEYMREYRKKHGNKMRKQQREYYTNLRLEILEHYGGKPPKCATCGEDRILCLQLDHIANDGAEHRRWIEKEYGYKLGGNQILLWIKKNNFPKKFQVLCANCNILKKFHT